jgi:carboxypeptidase PM20D1
MMVNNTYKQLKIWAQTCLSYARLSLIGIFLISFKLSAQEIKIDSVVFLDAVKVLSEYIQINSESGNEEKAALFFAKKCEESGLHVTFFSKDSGSYNFMASVYPLDVRKPNIVFFNHIDVVGPLNEKEWRYPPYSGTVADNKVWGRGALDNKGLAVIQLFSVLDFVEQSKISELPYNISLLCVSGEETGGMSGSGRVASEFIKEINPIVIIGEGGSGYEDLSFISEGKTLFGISIAEKGILKVNLKVDVKTNGHSSIVGTDYAHKRLINALFHVLNSEQKIEITNEAKLMFHGIGQIIGGIQGFGLKNLDCPILRPALKHQLKVNPELEGIFKNTITFIDFLDLESYQHVVTASSEARLDCRLLPGVAPEKFLEDIRAIIKDSLIKIEIINQYQERYTSLPDIYFEHLRSAIKKTFKNAEVVPILFPAYSDNAYYRKYGYPTFGINPFIVSKVQLSNIHNIDEYIDFDDIVNGIHIYNLFIQQVMTSHTTKFKTGLQ